MFRATSAGPTSPPPKNRACRAASSATPIASAVDSAFPGFLRLTPSVVLPLRISRNTVASNSITGRLSFAGRL